jgi:hypothetical protein
VAGIKMVQPLFSQQEVSSSFI